MCGPGRVPDHVRALPLGGGLGFRSGAGFGWRFGFRGHPRAFRFLLKAGGPAPALGAARWQERFGVEAGLGGAGAAPRLRLVERSLGLAATGVGSRGTGDRVVPAGRHLVAVATATTLAVGLTPGGFFALSFRRGRWARLRGDRLGFLNLVGQTFTEAADRSVAPGLLGAIGAVDVAIPVELPAMSASALRLVLSSAIARVIFELRRRRRAAAGSLGTGSRGGGTRLVAIAGTGAIPVLVAVASGFPTAIAGGQLGVVVEQAAVVLRLDVGDVEEAVATD